MNEKKIMDILHRKRFIIVFFTAIFLCLICLYTLLRFNEKKNIQIDVRDFDVCGTETGEYIYCFDTISGNGDTDISGWMIHKGESVRSIAIKLVLKETDSDTAYIIPTEIKAREDVTTAMNDGCSYDNCGFYVYKDNIGSKLDINKKDYEIYFYSDYNSREFLLDTKKTLRSFGDSDGMMDRGDT